MKRLSIIIFALLGVSLSALAQEPARYEVQSGIVKSIVDMGGQTSESTLYFDDYGRIQCTVEHMEMPGLGDWDTVTIIRDGMTYIINAYGKVRTVERRVDPNYLSLTDEDIQAYKITEGGIETVDGRECKVYNEELRQLGRKNTVTVYVWNGIPVKTVISRNGKVASTATAREIQLDASLPDDIFDVEATSAKLQAKNGDDGR